MSAKIRSVLSRLRSLVPMGIVRSDTPVSEKDFRRVVENLISALEDIDRRLEKLERKKT